MKDWTFCNKEQVSLLRDKIIKDTDSHVELAHTKGIELLKEIKFTQMGYDPVLETRTNFIEQVNQTFTYLVTLHAIEYLLDLYPQKTFRANFGTKAGYDIESIDKAIICECFTATAPDSNRKLQKDVERLITNNTADIKFVFYYAENDKPKHIDNIKAKYPSIEIIAISGIL